MKVYGLYSMVQWEGSISYSTLYRSKRKAINVLTKEINKRNSDLKKEGADSFWKQYRDKPLPAYSLDGYESRGIEEYELLD